MGGRDKAVPLAFRLNWGKGAKRSRLQPRRAFLQHTFGGKGDSGENVAHSRIVHSDTSGGRSEQFPN